MRSAVGCLPHLSRFLGLYGDDVLGITGDELSFVDF